MSLVTRLAVLSIWPLVGLAALALSPGLDAGPGDALVAARRWLAALLGCYTVSAVVAWRLAGSWTVNLVRMLLWGVVAYLCLDQLIYLFGESDGAAWQIVGADGPLGAEEISIPRWRAVFWSVALGASITSIAVGFEKREQSSGDGG